MPPENDNTPRRIATYMAARQRLDAPARGGGPARDARLGGKRSKDVHCKPPNRRCGARCIPPNWNCRVSGGGLDSHSRVVAFDPVAGVGGVWRGGKNLKKGLEKGDPELISRGAKGIERGITKLTPGDDLEKKQRFRRNVKTASTIVAIAAVGFISARGAHRTLNKTAWYRERFGRSIDRAAYRARERFFNALDRVPLLRSRRPRPMSPEASAQMLAHGLGAYQANEQRLSQDPRFASTLADRITGRYPQISDVPGIAEVRAIDHRARAEGWSETQFIAAKAQALYGMRRGPGQPRGSAYSDPAAHELLAEQFGLRLVPQDIRRGQIYQEGRSIERQLTERFTALHESLTGDMRGRGLDPGRPEDRRTYLERFVADHPMPVGQGLPAATRTALEHRYSQQVEQILSATTSASRTQLSRGLIKQTKNRFDEYFAEAYNNMRRNGQPGAELELESSVMDANFGLARLHAGNGFGTTPRNRDHGNLLNHVYYDVRVRGAKVSTITPNRARRVAAGLQNTTPSALTPQQAIQYLREQGMPQLHLTTDVPPNHNTVRRQAPASTVSAPRVRQTPAASAPPTSTPTAPAQAPAPRTPTPPAPEGTRRKRRPNYQQQYNDLVVMLQNNLNYSPEAAHRRAEEIVAERRRRSAERRRAKRPTTDSPEGDLPPRVRAYLATRARLDAKGKPCGESYIAANKKCGAGAGSGSPEGDSPAPAKRSHLGRNLAIGAAAAGALAAGAYANRQHTDAVISSLSQKTIKGLSSERVDQGLSRLPKGLQDQARQLVGGAKVSAAHLALTAKGGRITSVDVKHNFSNWTMPDGTLLSTGSVKDTLLIYNTHPQSSIGGAKTFSTQFRIDGEFDAKSASASRNARQVVGTVKKMFQSHVDQLPDNSIIYSIPYAHDGKGESRKGVYEKYGFTPVSSSDERLFAMKTKGKFTKLKPSHIEQLADLLRNDAAEAPVGKPCGASHIAASKKCGKGTGAAATPEGGDTPPAPSPAKGTGRKVALAAGAAAVIAAVGVTGYLVARDAKRFYKNEELPSPISYRAAVKLGKGGDLKVKHDAALGNYYDSVVAKQGWKPGELVYTSLPSNSNPGAPSGAHFAVYMGKSGSMHQFAEIIVDETKRGESFVSISDVGAGAKRMPPLIYTKAPPLKGEARPYTPEQISQRIYSGLGGRMRYDKLDNNCESWARMIVSGQPRSTQVERLSKVTQTLVRGLERVTGPRPSAGTPSLAQVAKRLDLYERINAGDRGAVKELKVFEDLLKKGKRTDAATSPLADLPEPAAVLAGATSDVDVVLRTKHYLMLLVTAAQSLASPERGDAAERRLGKPCGKSHIARNLKCHSESGTTKALRTAAKVALVAGAVAGGVAIAKQWTKADDDAFEEAVRANRLAPEYVKKYEGDAKDPEVAELRAQREADRIKRCGRQDSGKPEAGRSDAFKDCARQIGEPSAFGRIYVSSKGDTVFKAFVDNSVSVKEINRQARNEFAHMQLAHDAGVDVPRPVKLHPITGVIEMEYLKDADSLRSFHKNSALAPGRRLGIALDLADSVQNMHKIGVGHYDLHSGNIMVTREGTPYLLDFGLARSLKHHDMLEAGDAIFNDLHRLPQRMLECASDRPAVAANKEINDWLTMRHLRFVHHLQNGTLPEAALASNIDAYYRDLHKAVKFKLTNPQTTISIKSNL